MLSAVNPRLTLNVGGPNKPLSGSLQRRRYTYRVYDHGIGNYITRSRNTNELEFRYTVAKDDRETNGVSIAADNTLTLGLDCRPATATPDQDDKEDSEDSVILSPRTLTFTITDDDARGVTVDTDPILPDTAESAVLSVSDDGTTTTAAYTGIPIAQPNGNVTIPTADALDRVDLAPTGLLVFSPRRGPRRRRSP